MLRIHKYLASFMLCVVFLTQVFVVPVQAFLGDFSIKDEQEMGRKFEVLIRSKLPIVEDPEIALYVNGIVNRIAKVIPPQPFRFTSGVVLHNSLNAFAVPGGHLFVFTGLIMQLNNEAELAGIIAHEMAHVTQRHVANRINRGKFLSIASILLAIAGIAAGGGEGAALAAGALGGGQAAMLNYSRMDEIDADDIGYQYLVAAGYPPIAMAGGFKKIQDKSVLTGGGKVPTYLSTHPDISTRITSIVAKSQSGQKHLNTRGFDNRRFQRVQTLLWARYGNIQAALHRFSTQKGGLGRMGTAMILARQHKVQEASKAFDAALAASPNDPLILREAGTFHYKKGDMQKAESLLASAMQKDRRDYMAQFFYARLLDDTGRTLQAEPYYRGILQILPYDSEVHRAYARSLGKSGKHFLAYLHLAYSAMYINDKKKTKQYRDKAKGLVKSNADKQALQRFANIYKERKEIWEEGI